MAKTVVNARDPYRWNASAWNTKEQWRRWEHVGMKGEMSLEDIKLDWVDKRVWDLHVKEAIESLTFDRTIEGASTVVMTMRDPNMRIFSESAGRSRPRINSKTKMMPIDQGWQVIHMTDLIERAVDIILDDVHFRLVKVRYNSGTSQVELTFEDRIIYWLRRKKGALKASRAQVSRAEFILRLLREVKAEKVPLICPELHQKQQIKKVKATDVTDDPDSNTTGFNKRQRFRVQGVTADTEQRRNMATVLDEANSVPGSRPKALKAAVLAVIQESYVRNLVSGDKDSSGILQVRASTAAPLHMNPRSIRQVVRHFMESGYWGKGGAIKLARENPSKSAGWVAQQCQGSSFPDRYDKWSAEANHWIDGWKGGGEAGGSGDYRASYQYTRNKDENSWACMTRLAEEVNWRVFPVGRAMYYMSEPDLFARRVRHVLDPDSNEFIDLECDIDWGKPVNEMTMRVVLDRWGAPPGCTIEMKGFGPPDGRWLVVSSTRDWFSPIAELTLHQPGESKREPAAERVARSETATGGPGLPPSSKSGQFFVWAKRISDHTTGYGHASHGKRLSQMTISEPHDCSASVSLALYHAGMWESSQTIARVSGEFNTWGYEGRGERITIWYNGGHVFAIFEKGAGVGHKRFDTGGPGGGAGPKLRDAWRSTSGFQARHWIGT